MTKVIAITGKGGTGKTAVATLLIRYLSRGRILVIANKVTDTNRDF